MLSAFRRNEAVERGIVPALGLNAPSGAQRFPTKENPMTHAITPFTSQCTFWRSMLSDQTPSLIQRSDASLNAPSGAQCLPTVHGMIVQEGNDKS